MVLAKKITKKSPGRKSKIAIVILANKGDACLNGEKWASKVNE